MLYQDTYDVRQPDGKFVQIPAARVRIGQVIKEGNTTYFVETRLMHFSQIDPDARFRDFGSWFEKAHSGDYGHPLVPNVPFGHPDRHRTQAFRHNRDVGALHLWPIG